MQTYSGAVATRFPIAASTTDDSTEIRDLQPGESFEVVIVGQYRCDPVLAAKRGDLRIENHVSSGTGFTHGGTKAVEEPGFREGDLAGRRCPQLVNETQCLVCRGW